MLDGEKVHCILCNFSLYELTSALLNHHTVPTYLIIVNNYSIRFYHIYSKGVEHCKFV